MYKSGNKKASVKLRDKTVGIKETKDLYGKLMVLTKSNRYINLKQAINWELRVHVDTEGHVRAKWSNAAICTDNSKLILLLDKLGTAEPPNDYQLQLQDESGLQPDAVDCETMDFTHT